MSVQEKAFYTIACDHFGCPFTIVDAAYDGEGTHFPTIAEVEQVWKDCADDLGWKRSATGGSHYCPEHAPIHLSPDGPITAEVIDPTPPPPPLFPDLESHS
jgi:hypothetical protein